jgi:porin
MKTVCLVLILVLLAAAGFADDRESGWQKAYPAAAADTAEAPVIETVQERSWRDSFWNNSTLTGDWFGQRTWLKDHGITIGLEVTQFSTGLVSGDDSHDWQHGGKGEFYVSLDGAKMGLWPGLSINIHGDQNFGHNANWFGGTLIPVNTGLAFPDSQGFDMCIEVVQKLTDTLTLKFGKLSMLDAAKTTPLKGGGGIDTFMNTALAAPITGLLPPEILGAFLIGVNKPVTWSLAVYDPESAVQKTGLERPFSEGVSFRASATLSSKPFGLQGFYGFKAMYSTIRGFDLATAPDLLLPPASQKVLATRSNPYFLGISIQQYLVQDPDDAKKGWGIFGEIGFSDGNPTPQQWAGLAGIGGTTLFPGRDSDRWGIAYFQNSPSTDLTNGLWPLPQGNEQGVEAFYNMAVTPWLHVTADCQWIEPWLHVYNNNWFVTMRTNVRF